MTKKRKELTSFYERRNDIGAESTDRDLLAANNELLAFLDHLVAEYPTIGVVASLSSVTGQASVSTKGRFELEQLPLLGRALQKRCAEVALNCAASGGSKVKH